MCSFSFSQVSFPHEQLADYDSEDDGERASDMEDVPETDEDEPQGEEQGTEEEEGQEVSTI